MGPLFSNFADQYKNTAQRFIAEDDSVVVECRGQVTRQVQYPSLHASGVGESSRG
jgi:hypothetical protein